MAESKPETVWDTILKKQLTANGYSPDNPLTWALGEMKFESVFTNYRSLEQLLKDLPAAQTPAQQSAGDAFQRIIQSGSSDLNPAVAGPLQNALAGDPQLHDEILRLWKEHPEALSSVIPEVQKTPQNADALVTQAYKAEYASGTPTVAVASAPAAHTSPKTAAAPKPAPPPATTASKPASSTPATPAATSGETASSAPAAPIAVATAVSASTSQAPADPGTTASADTVNSANQAAGPASGLAGIFSGGGFVALIANLIPFILNLVKGLMNGGGFGDLLKGFGLSGGSSENSGGLMSGIMGIFGSLVGKRDAQPSSIAASVATSTANTTADEPQPPANTTGMDNYHANQPNVASLKNATLAASAASSPGSGTTTKPDAANINGYHANHADLASLKVATGAPLLSSSSAPAAQTELKAKVTAKLAAKAAPSLNPTLNIEI